VNPTEFFITEIPGVIQMNDYSCGVAVVQSVIMHRGLFVYPQELADQLGTTKENGTDPEDIVELLHGYGINARMSENTSFEELIELLHEGKTLIVSFQAWADCDNPDYENRWEDGHYGILIGYNASLVFIEDPSMFGSIGYLKQEEFLKRWHDYKMENGIFRPYRNLAIIVEEPKKSVPKFKPIG